ncbi:MAG: penicillin-binding protein 2 [Verrucomicrobia bacterium]|nr:penicillin-binding protein 2 [Verrucomicrobiota bacterium]
MRKGFASSYRIVLLATGILVCFGGLGARLVWLHVLAREQLLGKVNSVRQQITIERARRGDILDARGAPLATSAPMIVLGVDPWVLRKEDEARWPQLAGLLDLPEAELRRIFTTKYRVAASKPATASGPASAAGLVFNFNVTPPPAPAAVAPADEEDDLDGEADANGRREKRWAVLRRGVSESTKNAALALGIKGVRAEPASYKREYPFRQLASHVVGFIEREQVQATRNPSEPLRATGIERYCDFYLRGQDGWRKDELDGRNRELPQFNLRKVPHTDGYSVTLTLDLNVQDVIEEELKRIASTFQPLKASIVVSDPRTGFILGMANYPTYDPNEYAKIPKEEMARLRNVAMTDIYEPGSVFKIVAASGALEEGLVTPDSRFDCSLTSIEYKGKPRGLPREDHHFGHLTVAEIISHSSNRGAAQLAMQLGDQKFYNYARAFGFGHTTGLPGGAEENGMMAPPAKWDGLTITRMPMGHSVSVTVLQMHQAMSVIASGGVLLRPQIIREIRDEKGEIVARFDRTEERRVISEATARTMARMLMGVASKEGTALEAAIPGYEVAGKTGTTQKLEPVSLADGTVKQVYSARHHVASFVGFFPASRPQIVISVIVDDADGHAPGGVAYGRTVAAPSFKRIGEQLISYRDIKAGGAVVAPSFAAVEQARR